MAIDSWFSKNRIQKSSDFSGNKKSRTKFAWALCYKGIKPDIKQYNKYIKQYEKKKKTKQVQNLQLQSEWMNK